MLTELKARTARPRDRAYKLTDAHRLYLLVAPGGGKSWKWSYASSGKQKTLSIGPYPLIGVKEARERRDEAKRALLDGHDPGLARKLAVKNVIDVQETTFELVAREWHKTYQPTWAVRHAADVLRCLERDLFPGLGDLPISMITPPKVLETLRAVEGRNAIETAKRARQRISAIYAFAIASGLAESDPAEKVGAALKPLRKGRQPAITDLKALRRLMRDAEDGYARPVTRLALRFLALTVVRPGELRFARWADFEELDGPLPLWRIPAWLMKGDLERKEEIDGDHLVPLAPQSVEILRIVHHFSGHGPLVFPSMRHLRKPMSEDAIGYLLNRSGYHGRHVPHGFRAAFSTIMNEWAERKGKPGDRQIIDLMLAHVPKEKVEGAYNRAAYMPRRRELARAWAADMLVKGLPPLPELVERGAKPNFGTGRSQRVSLFPPFEKSGHAPSRVPA